MGTPVVEAKNLLFKYDERLKTPILSNVSFSIEKGEWVAIVGHNGSGKSTLAHILVGLLTPQEGSIYISGMKMDQNTLREIRLKIGMVFQNPENQFIGTTVADDVAFGLENLNVPYREMKKRVDEAIDLVGMSDFRNHDPSRLSGGQKQRVAIAGILALHPAVIVLDEAFVMLDPKSRRELISTIQQLKEKENLTVISITHDMNEAAEADRVLMLKEGKIETSGTPAEVFQIKSELEPPFAEKIRRELMKKNRNVPQTYMTEENLVNWLCK